MFDVVNNLFYILYSLLFTIRYILVLTYLLDIVKKLYRSNTMLLLQIITWLFFNGMNLILVYGVTLYFILMIDSKRLS